MRLPCEEAGAAAEDSLDLGARVRDLRKARGWTLEQAARRAGLARSTLSKIENGRMSPTYHALRKLAAGLHISVPELFTPPQPGNIGARLAVTVAGEGRHQATATCDNEFLGQALTRKRMRPCHGRIRARSVDEFGGWVRHRGEEFLYVLTGVIQLHTEFRQPIEMRRGDSAYFDAAMGHKVISLSDEDATVLWVTSRP